jgi:uncharacterized protein
LQSNTSDKARYWIDTLKLERHVEGGSFRETYRSPDVLPGPADTFPAGRSLATNIYFLLEQGQFSAFHKIRSDESWHFYAGDTLHIFEIFPDGQLITHKLGSDPGKGEQFQVLIQAGNWFGSRVAGDGTYTLAGCTVAPGFDFKDFVLGDFNTLSHLYPAHEKLIREMTYS